MENFDKKNTDFAFHVSRFTFHVSRFTFHVLRFTLHVSRFTFHVLLLLLPMLIVHIPFAAAQQRSPDQIIEAAIRHQNLGLAYLEESQPSKAVEEFQALVNLVPDEPIGYGNLAVAYLRLKKGDEAEGWVKRGIEVNPMDSKLHLILAEVYQWQGKAEEGVAQIQEAVKLAPEDMEARYLLVRYYLGQRNNPEATAQAITHLRILRQQSQTNVVVRLKLAQALLERDQIEEAKQTCMELSALLWDADEDALKYLKDGQRLMDQGDAKGAARQIRIFENVQRITPRYQQGIGELVTNILGHPIEKFSPGFRTRIIAKQSPPIEVRFVDVTQAVGLGNPEEKRIKVILTDYDNDGNLDVYTLPSARNSSQVHDLFRNEGGKFVPVAKIAWSGLTAAFADFDKDGDQDVFVQPTGQAKFYRNDGNNKFTEFAEAAGIHNDGGRRVVIFIDYDHDGDLDIFATTGKVEMYRNNGDGTFGNVGDQTFLPPDRPSAMDAAFGDFDDDGDIDLFVVNERGCTLYTNLRQGKMQAITDKTGIPQDRHFIAVAAGDYDNDGALDVFLTTEGETSHHLYRNRGDGTFVPDTRSQAITGATRGVYGFDAHFLDYDNDGFLDLWVVGKREGEGRGIFLFRNDGTGRFTDASNLLPDTIRSGFSGAVGDYDNDGDLDLFLIDADDRVVVLRNEGGNKNGWLQVRLEGVNAGNNKNNIDGIGSKVEVKVGDLYQMKYIIEPITHFGVGAVKGADVLRVVWTNGVPQNVILPQANQRLLEKQVLKGSCPFLYVYDGEKYQFLTDLLWRSPLGMITSMGTPAFADSAEDYVKIPGDRMKPTPAPPLGPPVDGGKGSSTPPARGGEGGGYSLQITEELWETAYFDQVKLIAVDHPAGTQIFVDEKFIPPPFPEFKIYTAREVHRPRAVFDHHGRDVSDALKEFDYHYAIAHEAGTFQGVVEPHFIVLDLGDVPNDRPLTLFLTGWVFPTDTSINVSLSQNPSMGQTFPYLQVRDAQGEWQTVIDMIGIPAGKNKTISVDLTGKFLSADRQVKIATDMQVYWDSAFFTIGEGEALRSSIGAGSAEPIQMTELLPHRADLHYRGFSEMYRPTPHAPHLFDYEKVAKGQQWRDLAGDYTRYGDVTPLLQNRDDMYVIMNAGDEMTVEFDAAQLPPLQEGWVRDFVLFSDGWVKDGDINTLFSQTVEPLPFHGMSGYPYPEGESYPNDPEHLRYRLEYNTRRVTHELPRF